MKNPIIVEHVKNFARCFVLVMDRKNQLLLPKMGNLKQTAAYPEFCTFFTLRSSIFFSSSDDVFTYNQLLHLYRRWFGISKFHHLRFPSQTPSLINLQWLPNSHCVKNHISSAIYDNGTDFNLRSTQYSSSVRQRITLPSESMILWWLKKRTISCPSGQTRFEQNNH